MFVFFRNLSVLYRACRVACNTKTNLQVFLFHLYYVLLRGISWW